MMLSCNSCPPWPRLMCCVPTALATSRLCFPVCILGPTIDVVGRTTFSYDSSRGNRIFSYDEVWEMEAAEALMQIFRPGTRDSAPGQ
ncbi:unnamed protein product [Ectocarpus sp. 12 AP-2014]